jgi:hypothetical protein
VFSGGSDDNIALFSGDPHAPMDAHGLAEDIIDGSEAHPTTESAAEL